MRTITAILLLLVAAGYLMAARPCRADDLNDGIEADESSTQYGELGNSSRNYSYLKQRAKSLARSGSSSAVISDSTGGSLNSVILDAGAQINGNVYIIDESKGDKTVLTK